MLHDLRILPLACECVFYRSELHAKGRSMELNFEGLEMRKMKYITG